MAVPRRCPNGHDWPATVGRAADHCPVCGAIATADGAPTVAGSFSVFFQDKPTVQANGGSPAAASLAVPVPGYELLGELGRGGMGVVFRARQVQLNRVVALKMVLSGELASATELARFKAEAEAVAQLHHPNIVQLYEFGESRSSDGAPLPYFALEYVNGGSLADRLKGVPQPVRSSAKTIEDCARAMHYAHSRGVIHRDLKPGNVLLSVDGNFVPGAVDDNGTLIPDTRPSIPKITDFGLAKRMDSTNGQTQSGAILGTPQYMAPEQAAGKSKRVGPATDIYALGAVLYELITGRPPFQGETPLETILQVSRDEPVPPRLLNPTVPRDLETITLKCLQKDPNRRYEAAQGLADDLARFLDDQPITARPAGPIERSRAWMRRHPTATTLLSATFVAAAALLAMGYASHHALTIAYERDHRRLVEVMIANGARRADDGDVPLALPWYVEALELDKDDPGRAAVHRMRLAAAIQQCPPLTAAWTHPCRVTDVAFSHGDRAAATSGDDGLVRVWNPDRPDEPALTFNHGAPVARIAYSADGGRLLIVGGKTVHIWNPAGESIRAVALDHPSDVSAAAWAMDRRRIVTACADGFARVWDAETGRPTGIEVQHTGGVTAVAVSQIGGQIATGGADKIVRVWELTTGKPSGQPFVLGDAVKSVALKSDGTELLTVAGRTAQLWNANTGKEISPPLSYRQDITDAALSPDGKRVAIVTLDGTGGVWEGEPRKDWADDVLRHSSIIKAIAFNHDGRWVATASDDNTARVWDARYGSPLTPRLPHVGTLNRAVFSDSDKWLLTAGDDGLAKLWNLRIADEEKKLPDLPPPGPFKIRSRDGSIVLKADGGTARIYDARSSEPLSPPLAHGGSIICVAISPDGELAATASTDRSAVVWNWRAGKPVGPPLRHGSRVNDVIFSPDGGRVATGSDDNTARVWNASTAEPLTTPLPMPGSVHAVRFNPGGNLLLSATKGRYAQVWAATGGEAIAFVPRTRQWVETVLNDANSTMKWDLPTDPRPVLELKSLAEWWSGHRLERPGGLVPIDAEELRKIGDRVRAAGN